MGRSPLIQHNVLLNYVEYVCIQHNEKNSARKGPVSLWERADLVFLCAQRGPSGKEVHSEARLQRTQAHQQVLAWTLVWPSGGEKEWLGASSMSQSIRVVACNLEQLDQNAARDRDDTSRSQLFLVDFDQPLVSGNDQMIRLDCSIPMAVHILSRLSDLLHFRDTLHGGIRSNVREYSASLKISSYMDSLIVLSVCKSLRMRIQIEEAEIESARNQWHRLLSG